MSTPILSPRRRSLLASAAPTLAAAPMGGLLSLNALAAAASAGKFTGICQQRSVEGGVGHNLPQEAPAVFTHAVIDLARP